MAGGFEDKRHRRCGQLGGGEGGAEVASFNLRVFIDEITVDLMCGGFSTEWLEKNLLQSED